MGSGTFTTADWTAYAKNNVSGKTVNQIYTASRMKEEFSPFGVLRESCDSEEHPNSTPIIIGLDVTGSMEDILSEVANQLGNLVTEILERKPVTDPQILFAAIGDSHTDHYSFQCTQFESDIRIAKQLTDLYFERGGGGNGFESYPLAWYFAANHTKCDNFEKRGKKGFIFTMGDDSYPKTINAKEVRDIFDDRIEGASDLTMNEVLTQANRKWEIFHLCLKQGWNMSGTGWGNEPGEEENRIVGDWTKLIGERAIPVSDYTKIPQIIVSILERMAGKSVDEIAESWDGSTAVVVREALQGLTEKKDNNELVEF